MWNSAAMCFQDENRGQDSFRATGARDRNSANFLENKKDDLSKMPGELVEMQMIKRKEPAGIAARALRTFRERVKNHPDFPELTLSQMSKECGFYNKAGDTPASTYQYNEREFTGKYFTRDKVDKFKIPLVRRGIPEAEIYAVLTGVPNTSLPRHSEVNFVDKSDMRDIPVLSRQSVFRLARGELKLGKVARLSPDAKALEAAGVIMGWMSLPDANDDTVIMDLNDGRGSRVVVDRSKREQIEGNSYICALGESLVYGTIMDGMLYSEEGNNYGDVIDLQNHIPVIFGQVMWLMERKSR